MKTMVIDSISRELSEGATRRGVLRLLGGVTAAGLVGATGLGETAAAKRRGRKRGKRSKQLPEQSQAGQNQVPAEGTAAARATSIPPNCIYVCCDGTCDSWTMCLKCFKWPKPTTTTTISAAS